MALVYLFIACFIAHEIEEVIILPPWIQRHQTQLEKLIPTALKPILSISRTGFSLIALWEGLIVLVISVLYPLTVWWFGIVAAYTLHLLLHCGQFFMLKKQALPIPVLLTVPLEPPLCFYILAKGLSVISATHLVFASAIWTVIAAVNLVAAHTLWHRYNHAKSD